MKTWRDAAQRVVWLVVSEVGTEDQDALRQALYDAYPFGQRKFFPYKVWCQEVRRALGKEPNSQHARLSAKHRKELIEQGQLTLEL